MRKQKPPPEPAPPKRKRARRSKSGDGAATGGKGGGDQYTDEEIRRIYRRVERSMTPRIFAVTARELGFVRARPRDFFCLCPPHGRTGVPDCCGEVEGCPYAGRFSPEDIERPGAYERLMARLNRIIAARVGQYKSGAKKRSDPSRKQVRAGSS